LDSQSRTNSNKGVRRNQKRCFANEEHLLKGEGTGQKKWEKEVILRTKGTRLHAEKKSLRGKKTGIPKNTGNTPGGN